MDIIQNNTCNEYSAFDGTIEYLTDILKTFTTTCYRVFLFGNIIMCLILLFMGLNLLSNAKEEEYKERINARNLEYLKKRGRIGTSICFFLAIGFFFKGLTILILWLLNPLPAPLFFKWFGIESQYYKVNTLDDINSLDVFEKGILFFICLCSFFSTLLLIFGLYLIFFNKRILRTDHKPLSLVIFGLISGIVFGFAPGFWLLL